MKKPSGTVEVTSGQRVERYIVLVADKVPEQARKYILKAAPFVGKAADLAELAIPHLIHAYQKFEEVREKAKPYKLELLIPSFIGLIMCFFGGTFLTLIAAVEAYRLTGWKSTAACVEALLDDFQKLKLANEKDDEEDLDGDGVADVQQISNDALVKRKILMFLKTVDPKRLTDAVGGINAGFLAVVATLKMQFAKAITLGSAIANNIKVPADKYVTPWVEKVLPPEYKRWGQPLVHWHIDGIAISIAWTVQRVLSAWHSALIGGLLVSRNMLEYLCVMGVLPNINHEDTIVDEIAGYALSAVGLLFQLTNRFGLPFPLNVLLFPLTVLEWVLVRIVMSK